MSQESKSLQIRKMLLKAFGKCVSPYYYFLSIHEAKKLLNVAENKACENAKVKPSVTLAIV